MMRSIVFFLMVVVAIASAQYILPHVAYTATGAYGAHGPFAVSSQARVDAPRNDLIGVGFAHYY